MSERRWWTAGRIGTLLLLAALVLGIAVPPDALRLEVENPDRTAVDDYRAALGNLPAEPLVVVGFDPDFGTYPEIRGRVRGALDGLLAQGALLALISFTPEGRALAAAELARLAEAGFGRQTADLGFVSGAEAGLVRSVAELRVPAGTRVADRIEAGGGGLGAFDAALLVAGIDFGPRAWVEQVLPRTGELPLIAIAPSFLWPELAPYRATGQLDALLGTVRDGAGLAAEQADAPRSGEPPPLALAIGMLVALVVFVATAAGAVVPPARPWPGAEEAG